MISRACDACGTTSAREIEIASADQIASQIGLARDFHNGRLTRRSRAALEERARFTHDYPASLLACPTCDLVYRSPRPPDGSLRHAYAEERYSRERLPQMLASQRALFQPKARWLARVLAPGARVLEVGSFVGGFLREARDAGLEAIGVDPNEQMAELNRRAGLEVVPETIESFAERPNAPRFDGIAIWNTFDQLPHPRAALAAVLRLLRPAGVLLLRFPHGACYRRLMRIRPLPVRELAWNNLLGFPYLHGYGLRSLDALAKDFRILREEVRGDALGRAADESYALWARVEERWVKWRQRQQWQRDLGLAPWLEVSLRREAHQGSKITGVPGFTSSASSSASQFVNRTQPCDSR